MFDAGGPFLTFLLVAFFCHWLVAHRPTWRVAMLVATSGIYYAQAGPAPLALLMAIATVDFTVARRMRTCGSKDRRAWLLRVSLATDVGALGVFKYANFFLDASASGLGLFGAKLAPLHLELLAPVGISFFVFQSLGYVLDVYRRSTTPAPTFAEYLAFVSFFPTIVAGPIMRLRDVLPQLRGRASLDDGAGGRALFLIALGFTKKIAIGDYLGANLVDRVFDFPERFSSLEVLAAVYGYALQIYADFSGYSDVAIGAALLLGIVVGPNFDAPYRARSLPEFWRRWHISLSTWLRDYVFYAIVGRGARSRGLMYGALIATMAVGGLWHGPSWTFVVWGLMHGVGLAAARWLEARGRKLPAPAAVLVTFHYVCLTWIFFRAESLSQATSLVRRLFDFSVDTSNLTPAVVLVMAVGFAAHAVPDRALERVEAGFARLPAFVQSALLFALAAGLYQVASTDAVPFIYARF